MKHLFCLLFFFVFSVSYAQQASATVITLEGNLENVKKSKRLKKKIEKMKNPKWLKVVGDVGFFVDNKSSYVANNSFESRQQYSGRALNQSREELVYGNIGINRSGQYDYDRLETRITQIALFRPEIKELEIQIAGSCDGYQDIQYLFLIQDDLRLVREINTQANFLKGFKVTEPTVFRKMEAVTQTLCK